MTRQTVEDYKVKNGEAFRVNVTENLASGGTLNCHISNPSGSGKNIVITKVKSGMVGPFTNKHPVRPDVTDGDSAFVENRRSGDDYTGIVEAYKNSSWSNADKVEEEYYGKDDSAPGNNDNAVGGDSDTAVGSVMENSEFVVGVENRSDSTAYDAFITVEYYETSDE